MGSADLKAACEAAVAEFLPHARFELGVDELATRAGVEVTHVPNPGFDGRIVWSIDGQPRIEIATGRPTGRTRFTVAHELGHWVIWQVLRDQLSNGDRYRSEVPIDESSRIAEERLANALAAEIVIPAARLREAAKFAVTPTLVRHIARERRVSIAACLRRFAEVLLVHAVVLRAMPMWFSRPTSVAEVDAASVYRPDGSFLRDRSRVRFATEIPFCLLGREAWNGLSILVDEQTVRVRGHAEDVPGADPCCEIVFIELVDA